MSRKCRRGCASGGVLLLNAWHFLGRSLERDREPGRVYPTGEGAPEGATCTIYLEDMDMRPNETTFPCGH